MKRFEYKVLWAKKPLTVNAENRQRIPKAFEDELNRLGAEGWELVQWHKNLFFLKREIMVEPLA